MTVDEAERKVLLAYESACKSLSLQQDRDLLERLVDEFKTRRDASEAFSEEAE